MRARLANHGLGIDGQKISWDGAVCNIVCGSIVVLQAWMLVHLCNCGLVFVRGSGTLLGGGCWSLRLYMATANLEVSCSEVVDDWVYGLGRGVRVCVGG